MAKVVKKKKKTFTYFAIMSSISKNISNQLVFQLAAWEWEMAKYMIGTSFLAFQDHSVDSDVFYVILESV